MASIIYPKPGSTSTVYVGKEFVSECIPHRRVGGFDQNIDESKLWSIFEPFGEIKEVFIPRDRTIDNAHKGFGFVELAEEADARAAIENVHMNQFFGQTLKCNLARPSRIVLEGVNPSSGNEPGSTRGAFING